MLIVIAASFGIGAAIEESGLATVLGREIVETLQRLRLALRAARHRARDRHADRVHLEQRGRGADVPDRDGDARSSVGADPRAFAIAVAISASHSFLTPIGYQTNTMVYGPGGYRFSDYVRLGAPLTVASVLVVVLTA